LKRPTEEISLEQYHALGKRQQRQPKPRRPREPSTGLSTMLLEGWRWTFNPRYGFRLDKGGLTSGWCSDEATAVRLARLDERAAKLAALGET